MYINLFGLDIFWQILSVKFKNVKVYIETNFFFYFLP